MTFLPWMYIGLGVLFSLIGFAFLLPSQGLSNGVKISQKGAFLVFVILNVMAVVLLVIPFFQLFFDL